MLARRRRRQEGVASSATLVSSMPKGPGAEATKARRRRSQRQRAASGSDAFAAVSAMLVTGVSVEPTRSDTFTVVPGRPCTCSPIQPVWVASALSCNACSACAGSVYASATSAARVVASGILTGVRVRARAWLGVSAATLVLAAPAGGSVLVVGDSLEEGTGPHLRERLEGIAVTVDARRGRPSSEGLEVLRSRLAPEHDVVVFDLGSNDDPRASDALAANLSAAAELVDGRCLVVASLNLPPRNGITIDGLDRAVRDFVARTPNARLVDWRAAAAEPGVLAPDGAHATPAGYSLRASLVAEAVHACLRAAGAPVAPPPRARRRAAPAVPIEWTPLDLDPRRVVAYVAGARSLLASALRDATDVLVPGRAEPVLGGSG
jgi:lysophospholipase L1-like esterase